MTFYFISSLFNYCFFLCGRFPDVGVFFHLPSTLFSGPFKCALEITLVFVHSPGQWPLVNVGRWGTSPSNYPEKKIYLNMLNINELDNAK